MVFLDDYIVYDDKVQCYIGYEVIILDVIIMVMYDNDMFACVGYPKIEVISPRPTWWINQYVMPVISHI